MSSVIKTSATRIAVPLITSAALALAVAAVAVILVLSLTSGGATSVSTPAPMLTASPGSDIRYDGGPEEGTRGPWGRSLTRAGAAKGSAPAVRYDGGPEEGTRDPYARR